MSNEKDQSNSAQAQWEIYNKVLLSTRVVGKKGLASFTKRLIPHEIGMSVENEFYKVTRISYTNPIPESVVGGYKKKYKHNPFTDTLKKYIQNRETYESVIARKYLNCLSSGDKRLIKKLIQQRIENQQPDGSWDTDLVRTSKILRELKELGVPEQHESVKKGIAWILEQAESEYNPGMFFFLIILSGNRRELYNRETRENVNGSGKENNRN